MTTVPRQPSSPDEEPRQAPDRGRVIRRRALTLLTIVLLIGIPAGYLVISANQSRNSGKDKEAKYSATGLTIGWPSKVQRRLYETPIPGYSRNVAYYETNNYKVSRLYAQFLTSNAGLDTFLKRAGSDTDELKKGDLAISDRDRNVAGWEFTGPGPWYGLTRSQKDPSPTQTIVVNRSNPDHPMVFVVSMTHP
ncbi:sugar kinase [Streptomyces kunmingensis]|uniref:Sugar kinase n=1 Tax=Streptomyces kunmingensis TaxID=68225 RepID=A0ABU6C7X0_9ACTN|nr:sugar kinase [Streptomyces kunmingensis]MEB3960809.1 sugar kinase [Streptomyces kunmingensis]